MSNSDTPRTDALANIAWDGAVDEYAPYAKMMNHARQLERALAELKAKYRDHHEEAERLTRELADANKATERAKAYKRVLKDENARLKVELSNCQSGNRSLAQSLDEAREQRDEWFSVATLKTKQLGDLREQRDALAGALWHAVNRMEGFEAYMNGERSVPPSVAACLEYARLALDALDPDEKP
jgi:chromosome segregation ATPase